MPEAELSGDDTNGICAKVFTTYQEQPQGLAEGAARSSRSSTSRPSAQVDANASANARREAVLGLGATAWHRRLGRRRRVQGGARGQRVDPRRVHRGRSCNGVRREGRRRQVQARDDDQGDAGDGLPEAAVRSGAHQADRGGGQRCGRSRPRSLKDMGPKLAQSFKDQAMCITGQITAAVDAATRHPAERVGLGVGLGVGQRRPSAVDPGVGRRVRCIASPP